MSQEIVPTRRLINQATGEEIEVELITSVNIGGKEIELEKPVLGNMSVMQQVERQAEEAAGESESKSNSRDTGGDEGI